MPTNLFNDPYPFTIYIYTCITKTSSLRYSILQMAQMQVSVKYASALSLGSIHSCFLQRETELPRIIHSCECNACKRGEVVQLNG